MNLQGKITRDYPNMRTEFVWAWMLDADFIPYDSFNNPNKYLSILEGYDFLLFIPSKNKPQNLIHIQNCPIPHGIMQEGGRYQWMEWLVKYQELYLEVLNSVDVVLCHNNSDIPYFKGLTNKPVEKLGTYQFIDYIYDKSKCKLHNIFIGGHFNNWYGGRHSYEAIKDFDLVKIGFPTMGRIQADEKEVIAIKDCRVLYYDYMTIPSFINTLSHYKASIHLMPISAAGSFSLNSAIAGIPCIGNSENDTDKLLFPSLCLDLSIPNFLKEARRKMDLLLNDDEFYNATMEYAETTLDEFNADLQKINLKKQFRRYI